jgi:hypothetical protein
MRTVYLDGNFGKYVCIIISAQIPAAKTIHPPDDNDSGEFRRYGCQHYWHIWTAPDLCACTAPAQECLAGRLWRNSLHRCSTVGMVIHLKRCLDVPAAVQCTSRCNYRARG